MDAKWITAIIVAFSALIAFVRSMGKADGAREARKETAEREEKFEGILADARETIELGKSDVDRARALRDRIQRRRMD